ncbi:nucleotidyltransferase domain-containing protein, partial [Candidatus Woesearchaeota archaeon]|nr:nucleotidyltransferase domain-containing protein [Candidatus Woesearchaeota archaeon]
MKISLISYSMDFASFLIQKIKNKDLIKNIILFGSVSREESEEESDIDLFIDVNKENSNLEKEIMQILEQFLDSMKYKNYWKLLGIKNKNEIKLTIGILDKWKELKPSIV